MPPSQSKTNAIFLEIYISRKDLSCCLISVFANPRNKKKISKKMHVIQVKIELLLANDTLAC